MPLTLWTLGLAQPWINRHFKRLHFRFTQPLQPKGRHISLIRGSNLILRPCVFWTGYRLTLSFPAVPHRAAFSPVWCSGGFPPQASLSRISVSPQCFLSRASLHVEHPGKASLLFLLLLHCPWTVFALAHPVWGRGCTDALQTPDSWPESTAWLTDIILDFSARSNCARPDILNYTCAYAHSSTAGYTQRVNVGQRGKQLQLQSLGLLIKPWFNGALSHTKKISVHLDVLTRYYVKIHCWWKSCTFLKVVVCKI